MLKNEVVHNFSETDRLERARRYDPNAVNGTEIHYRMEEILHFEIAQ